MHNLLIHNDILNLLFAKSKIGEVFCFEHPTRGFDTRPLFPLAFVAMTHTIREMTITDYEQVFDLWLNTEHMSLNECDSRDGIALYLTRNPKLCYVAMDDGALVATVLCGHDGRRGFLRHLAVAKAHRGRGIAQELVHIVLENLATQGIGKCNTFVEDDNLPGLLFWEHFGFAKLDDTFSLLQMPTSSPQSVH